MGDFDGSDRFALPELDLSFDEDQVQYLNRYFTNIEQTCNHALNSYYGTMTPSGGGPNLLGMDTPGSIEATIERLVQRLVTGVGKLDPRFASKFVLSTGSTYEHYKINRPDEYDFMIRLDQVSCPGLDGNRDSPPCRIIDDPTKIPHGFARVHLAGQSNLAKEWAEFLDSDGCLLPHKIRHRFFDLIRWAIKAIPASMEDVNECKLPGASGKVLDVGTLADIFHIDSTKHVFVAIGDPAQDVFPEPRDFSIKVVQDGPAVRLEINMPPTEELLEAHNVSVDLTLSIGFVGWPSMSDFPDRILQSHVDAVNSYRAAQKGFYVVGTGPHESIACQGKDSLWRISNSTAEMELMTHYDHCSIPAKVMRVMKIVTGLLSDPSAFEDFATDLKVLISPTVSQIDPRPLYLISSYALKTLFLFELEKFTQVEDWLESGVSIRVLSVMRGLLKSLEKKSMRSYFFPKSNVLLKKGLSVDLSSSDFSVLAGCIRRMHECSKKQTIQVAIDDKLESSIAFENDLSSLWRSRINEETVNQDGTETDFAERQYTYLNLVFTELIGYLKMRSTKKEFISRTSLNGLVSSVDIVKNRGIQRLLRLLNIILEQSRTTAEVRPLDSHTINLLTGVLLKNLEEFRSESHWEPQNTAQCLVHVLQTFVMDNNGNVEAGKETARLVKIFTSYLGELRQSSFENAWFVEDIYERLQPNDLAKVTEFAQCVVSGKYYAQQGLEEAVRRGEEWAM